MIFRSRKKRLLTALLLLVALYAVWLAAQIFRLRKQAGQAPRRGEPATEIQGVYHVHTTLSDGRRTADEIAAVAGRLSLHFLILTDHGRPNRASLGTQGWKENVLVLAGSELSVSRGHLVALDFAVPDHSFSQNAEQAAQEVAAAGGFSVIAHPFSKTRWSWGRPGDYSALEIIDNDSMVKKNFLKAVPYLPALLLEPRLFLLKTLERPGRSLGKWDELSRLQPFYGYFSADAHLFYSAVLDCFRLHVLLEKPLSKDFGEARSQVLGALRQGRFYCAVHAARPAGGFLFWAETGGTRLPMGSSLPFTASSPFRLRAEAPFPFAFEMRLLRDGEIVFRSAEKELSYPVEKPGAYRIEIGLEGWSPLPKDFPWVISNPIFVRENKP
jgi:hypothetical protein